jgi:hypothetical protein
LQVLKERGGAGSTALRGLQGRGLQLQPCIKPIKMTARQEIEPGPCAMSQTQILNGNPVVLLGSRVHSNVPSSSAKASVVSLGLGLQEAGVGRTLGLLAHRIGVALGFDAGGLGLLLRFLALIFDRLDIGLLHRGVVDHLPEGVAVLHVGQLEIGDLDPQYGDVVTECRLDRIAQLAALLGDRLDIDLAHRRFQPVDRHRREPAFVKM